MAKQSKQSKQTAKPVTPPIDDGYTQESTVGSLEGEWVKPVPGVVIEGKLERVFTVEQDDGSTSVAYAFRDVDGEVWCVGEKAAFRAAIRSMKLGTTCRLEFIEKVDIKNKQGGKTGKQAWKIDFRSKRDGAGITVEQALAEKRDDVAF